MSSDLFAWQGFSIPLTEIWRPTVLTGDFKKGYVRLEAERDDMIQIRWETARRASELNRRALGYIGSLETAARKRKDEFKYNVDRLDDGSALFNWHSRHKGYGRIWHDGHMKRVMLLERSGEKGRSFKREARHLLDSIETHAEGLRPWCAFGLSVRLPAEYALDSCKFLSGRITLSFAAKSARLTVDRWGLAKSLLGGRPLVDWAVLATDLADATEEGCGIRLGGKAGFVRRKLGWITTVLAMEQQEENQIVMIRSEHKPGSEPDWEWLR